jgi:hypothetical protein
MVLVFTGQGNVYLVRERNRLRHSIPRRWLSVSSAADVVVVSLMATNGILTSSQKGESVTHVSGTICYPCVGSLTSFPQLPSLQTFLAPKFRVNYTHRSSSRSYKYPVATRK